MQSEIVPSIPEIECYICGSTKIKKLCHSCGRAMCTNHGPFSPPETTSYFFRLINDEYTGIDFPSTVRHINGVHCEFCKHYFISYEPSFYLVVAIGIGIIILGSFFSVPPSSQWFAGLIFIALGVYAVFNERDKRFKEMYKRKPPLPIFGRFPSVTVQEFINGDTTITSDNVYSVRNVKANGELIFSLQLNNSDRKRLNQYCHKFKLDRRSPITFHVGSLVTNKTEDDSSEDWILVGDNPLHLIDEVQGEHFLLNGVDISSREWKRKYDYNLSLNSDQTTGMPIQLIPFLLSEGEDEWTLELYVQVNPTLNVFLSSPWVEELILRVPSLFAEVESHSPPALVDPISNRSSTLIKWRNIKLDEQNIATFSSSQISHKSFHIRFVGSKNLEPNVYVSGELQVRFDGTLSKLDSVTLFSALGERLHQVNTVKQTQVTLGFAFHLDRLQLRRRYSSATVVRHLVAIPGNETITRLVNALNAKQIYVQRVMEEPPHPNWANAQSTNRHWILTGRRYDKAMPIDFQIIVTGQERYERGFDKPFDGSSDFQITTQGIVITDNMRNRIDGLRDEIANIIHCVPSLEIELESSLEAGANRLYAHEWGTLIGTVRNIGKDTANDVTISVEGIKFERIDPIQNLHPSTSEIFELSIYPDQSGMVPIIISVICKDEHGQLSPWRKRYKLEVFLRPSTPLIGNQTNINGPILGPFSSGDGDINS